MKKYIFISTLRHLTIPEAMTGWLTLMPGINITNDQVEIQKVITEEFREVAGIIEYQHFLNADNILYCYINQESFGKPLDSGQALILWLSWLQMLLNDLWFIKDNAVVCEAAFCKLTHGVDTSWTRNNITNAAYNSLGQPFISTELSVEEMKSWSGKSVQVQTYLHDSDSTFFDSFINTNFSRVGRSMRFIQAAIKEQHPAVKLAHYCSAFESLFSVHRRLAGIENKNGS